MLKSVQITPLSNTSFKLSIGLLENKINNKNNLIAIILFAVLLSSCSEPIAHQKLDNNRLASKYQPSEAFFFAKVLA